MNTKEECSIASDLMPLYVEGLVSEQTRDFVERHCAACEACSETRDAMAQQLQNVKEEEAKIDAMKKANRRLRYTRLAAVFLAVVLVALGSFYLVRQYVVGVEIDQYGLEKASVIYDPATGAPQLELSVPEGYALRTEVVPQGDDFVQLHLRRVKKSFLHSEADVTIPLPNQECDVYTGDMNSGTDTFLAGVIVPASRRVENGEFKDESPYVPMDPESKKILYETVFLERVSQEVPYNTIPEDHIYFYVMSTEQRPISGETVIVEI